MMSTKLLITIYRYGWFWQCPNGEDCMYRHALPPGFVLKAQKKAQDDAARDNQISIEEFLEVEVRMPPAYDSLRPKPID